MTTHDEFLEILRVLVETPPSPPRKPPSPETEKKAEAVSDISRKRRGKGNRKGAGS